MIHVILDPLQRMFRGSFRGTRYPLAAVPARAGPDLQKIRTGTPVNTGKANVPSL